MPLSERDRDILDFERSWWAEGVSKEAGIRRRFGITPGRYYRVLADLVDRQEALDYDPLVVRRLRRAHDRRRRARFEGRPAGQGR